MKEFVTLIDGTKMAVHTDHIGKAIRTNRDFYEKPMLEYIKGLSKRRPFESILDLGANIGNHSVYFSKYCAKYVYGVEPVKSNFELLVENREINGLQNLFIFDVGIGRESGTATHRYDVSNMGACNLVRGEGPITIVTPEQFTERKFDLIKIDCEAMSGEIFEAFLPYIKEHKPHIFLEASPYEIIKFSKMAGGRVGKRFNATPTWHIYF